MDVVRTLFAALNNDDPVTAAALYHPQCQTEHVFAPPIEHCEGREAVQAAWAAEFAIREGALPGGHRFDVTRIAGIETGWGWVRAEWVSVTSGRRDGVARGLAGYSYFWIEDGLIRRHRSTAHEVPIDLVRNPRPTSERRYPSRPLVGVGAVIFSDDGRVVLVKRKHEPLAGQWSLPGGMLELGESLEAGVAREMLEETGLHVEVGPVIEVFDRIMLDENSRVRYHFVLVDYLCWPIAGTLHAGSDVDAVALVAPGELASYQLTAKATQVIHRGLEMALSVRGRG